MSDKSQAKIQTIADSELKSSNEKKRANRFVKCPFLWILTETNPVTYNEDRLICLGKKRKCSSLEVWLYPLCNLDSRTTKLVREISAKLMNFATEQLHEHE